MAEEVEVEEEEEEEEQEEQASPLTPTDGILSERLARPAIVANPERIPLSHEASNDPSRDALMRSGLVNSLIGLIRRLPKTSMVIAIEGRWGDGKTTVLNYARQRLGGECVFVDLEPWHWSQSGQISGALASSLEDKLFEQSRTGKQRKRDGFSSSMESLAKRLGSGFLKDTGKKALSITVALLGTLFTGLGVAIQSYWDTETRELAILALAAAFALVVLGGPPLLNWVSKRLRTKRLAVDEYIKDLQRKNKILVCVLDDVDRLTRDQILELCQLMKATLNVNGLHFILCMDRVAVQDILGGHTPNLSADHYLEKIVQHRLHIPTPTPELVAAELSEELAQVIASTETRRKLDHARYEEVVTGILMKDCRNLRDVQQVRDAFQLMLDSTRDSGGAVHIDIPDLLALASTYVFDPVAYQILNDRFQQEHTRAGAAIDIVFSLDKERKDVDDFISRFASDTKRGSKREALLKYLCPDQSGALLFRHTDNPESRRFQDSESAHLYFSLTGESFLSLSTVNKLFDAEATADQILIRLRELAPHQLSEFASILQGKVERGELVPSPTLVATTLYADEYDEPDSMLARRTQKNLWSLPSKFFGPVARYFSARGSGGVRVDQLLDYVASSVQLPLKVEVLMTANDYEHAIEAPLDRAWRAIRDDTEAWLMNPTSASSPFYLNVMYRHRDWVGEDTHLRFYSEASDEVMNAVLLNVMNHISYRKKHPWKDSAISYINHIRKLFGDRIDSWVAAHESQVAQSRLGAYFRSAITGETEVGDGMISSYELQNWYSTRGLEYPEDPVDDE